MKASRYVPLAIILLLGLSGPGRSQQKDSDALIEKGKAVATAADCMACHTEPKTGKPFAGGYGIVSPLGTIYSSNITPSKRFGIGDYSEQDFEQAVRKGIRKDGAHLYPAMPYDAYGTISDEDIRALYAYFMRGVQPVDEAPKGRTALPFPFNLRMSMAAWNLLFADRKPFTPEPTKSAAINRGAYLAGALGHCASCHAPRNLLMGQSADAPLTGGDVGPWHAPNITSDPVSGIGGWSEPELVQYFRTGRAPGKAQAAGGMAEAIENSLQHLPQSDLEALATYLKSTAPVRASSDVKPRHVLGNANSSEADIRGRFPQTAHDSLKSGAELYSGLCASCHQPSGAGSGNQAYPSLFHNTATGAGNPANLVATILYGVARNADGQTVLMPSFGKGSYVAELSDIQIADVANYVLANYGDPVVKVTPQTVATARAGGPMPFLARIQPWILPMVVAAGIAIVLILFGYVVYRRFHGRRTIPAR